MLTLLSSDPGYSNYGFSVLRFKKTGDKVAFKILENNLCHDTVSNLKDSKVLASQLQAYNGFIMNLIDKYQVDALCAERYMTRGISGPSIEMVNFMLGSMIQSCGLPVRLWPAATWKNAVRRQGVDLKYWYKYCKTTPHQLDSVLMGLYTGFFAYGQPNFGGFDLEKAMPKLIDVIESTTYEKLTNRKLRKTPK